MKRIEILALIVVIMIIAGTPALAFWYRGAETAAREAGGERLIIARTVENGGYQPARIVVKKGQRVKLRLTSWDVTHGFQLLDFGIQEMGITPGSFKEYEFVADRVGTFPFYCISKCSPLHQTMQGEVVVEP